MTLTDYTNRVKSFLKLTEISSDSEHLIREGFNNDQHYIDTAQDVKFMMIYNKETIGEPQ